MENFQAIYGHNILELYNVLVQFRYALGETKLDIKYNRLCKRAATRVVKRIKTLDLKKLRNTGWVKKNMPKIHFRITKVKRKFSHKTFYTF